MKIILPDSIIGIIGGGQLGRMTALAAASLGYKTHIYCPSPNSLIGTSAAQVASRVTYAKYDDLSALRKFAEEVDVISFEFENIPNDSVLFLEKIADVRPSSKVLYIAQNRLREKDFINEVGVATADYVKITSAKDLANGFNKLGGKKAILKTLELGYDGKGQVLIEEKDNLENIWQNGGMKEGILEEFIPFSKEISAIIARGIDSKYQIFPLAENVHMRGILDTSMAPANISGDIAARAKESIIKIADELGLIGILAVEFFVTKDGRLLVNEMAPRPHNSGHWTMNGCVTSQFEQFVRAICGLPLGSVAQHSAVRMKNLIGRDVEKASDYLKDPNAKLHLYGKDEASSGRKMGHVNFVTQL